MNNTPAEYYQDYMTYMSNQDHAVMSLIYVTIFALVVYLLLRRLSRDKHTGQIFTFTAQVWPYAVLVAYAWLYFTAWSRI